MAYRKPEPGSVMTASTDLATTTEPDPARREVDRCVSDRTAARILAAVPDNTRRAYTRQWDLFTDWCGGHARTPLPATGQTLAEYVGHLVDTGRSPATIEQATAAIRATHRTAGHDDRPDTRGARLVLRGHRRARAAAGHRARQAPPITIEALRAMVTHCDPATVIGLRDRVVLVLGMAMMGRRSELAARCTSTTSPSPPMGSRS